MERQLNFVLRISRGRRTRSDSSGLKQDNCLFPAPKFLSLSEGSSILRFPLIFPGENGLAPKANSYMTEATVSGQSAPTAVIC